MMFQMQNFINTFSDICEFDFLDGNRTARDKPIPYFVNMGIKPPFKSYCSMITQTHKTLPDGKVEMLVNKSTSNFEGPLETVLYIIDHINKQELAFDGIAGFS